VRAHPLASLIWLLFTAILAVLPLHAAFGAALTWKQMPDREELSFSFESTLPTAEPRQRGLTQVLIAIPSSFWQREPQPKVPNLSRSKLIKDVSVTADGIFIQTRSDDFLFSDSRDPKRKTLTVTFFLPPKEPEPAPADTSEVASDLRSAGPETVNASLSGPEAENTTNLAAMNASRTSGNTTGPNAINISAADTVDNATHGLTGTDASASANTTDLQHSEISKPSVLRAKISRTDQVTTTQTASDAGQVPDFRVRMHVDRNATIMDQNTSISGNATQVATPAPTPMPAPVVVATDDTTKAESAQSGPVQTPLDAPQYAQNAAETHPPAATLSGHVQDHPPRDAPAMGNATPETLSSLSKNDTAEDAPRAQNNASDPTRAPRDSVAESADESAQGNATDDNSTAELENLYAKAQRAIMAGDMQGARKALNDMIKHPKVNDDLRVELLYTLADIAMQAPGDFSGRIIFPVRDLEDCVIDLVGYSPVAKPRYKSLGGNLCVLFNRGIIEPSDPVFLSESLLDAVVLTQQGFAAAAVPGGGNFRAEMSADFRGKDVFLVFGSNYASRRNTMAVAQMLCPVARDVFVVTLPDGVSSVTELLSEEEDAPLLLDALVGQARREHRYEDLAPDARVDSAFVQEVLERQTGQFQGIPTGFQQLRSEERRVGKECRSRWSPYH